MSDGNQSGGVTAAGSGKSAEEVAFDLLNKLKGQGVWGERNMADILNMYAECLDAAKGLRAYEGQKRVQAPVLTQTSAARPAQQAPAQSRPQQSQPQPHQTQVPPAPAYAPHPQSPQGQQHTLQQAFKPG